MKIFFPKRQVHLELPTGTVIQMDYSSLDRMVLEIEFLFLPFVLELTNGLALGQVLFIVDSIDEI